MKKYIFGSIVIAVYPVFVLTYVWIQCFLTDFEGGKLGQLDAYRHTLASSVVAYTLSADAVILYTKISELSDSPDDLMDKHNNAIGATIGSHAQAFNQLNKLVLEADQKGEENTANPSQITWLSKALWKKGLFW